MRLRRVHHQIAALILVASALVSCGRTPSETDPASRPLTDESALTPEVIGTGSSPPFALRDYAFPESIDPARRYLFNMHGRIIEDQGLSAVSPEYGEYEYEAILKKLESHGFVVISEQRPKDTDITGYAVRVVEQINLLLNAGVPAEEITVVGASKGAGIAADVSSLLKNERTNFVFLGFCSPETVEEIRQDQIPLYGNILAIRDSADGLAGPCSELFEYSEGKGIGRYKEIVIHIGTGHGILYHPRDEWILPAVHWAEGQTGGLLTDEQAGTLSSLEQVDDHPLYTMYYSGPYTRPTSFTEKPVLPLAAVFQAQDACWSAWGCSLFAAMGDEENRLLGRNFDWEFSPALLLFADPPDGYASVSMVDIAYLGFDGARSKNLADLPVENLQTLLDTPWLPFDGMNEKGLAVGMAAVPSGDMSVDPQKETIGELRAIREILDHAATVDAAIQILGGYNIYMESVPIHYLIASASGESALVEFYKGKMVVSRNESPWQVATIFLVASTNGHARRQCWRYDLIEQRLRDLEGHIASRDAMRLLGDVSQDHTQWSILYHMTSGDLDIVMGREYPGPTHIFNLEQTAR